MWAGLMLCQEKANLSQELLSSNPGIIGLTEIVDFKRVYCMSETVSDSMNGIRNICRAIGGNKIK